MKVKDTSVTYKIVETRYNDVEAYQQMKKALCDVGVYFNVDDHGYLNLSIMEETYNRNKKRNAGRKKTYAINTDSTIDYNLDFYQYSDIVYMMQTMTDKQIYEKIGMKAATYYRHKKILKESKYYTALDKNKLLDKEYLNSLKYNYVF